MAKKSIKELTLAHIEKVVFGMMALVVVAVLATTPWTQFSDVTPDQINSAVKKSRETWLVGTWPDEERETYAISAEAAPANLVHERIYKPVSPAAFEMSGKMMVDLYSTTEPLKEPELVALNNPIATSSRVLIQLKDEEIEYDPQSADALKQLFPGQDPDFDDQEGIDDEFRIRQNSSGQFGGMMNEPGAMVPGMVTGGPRGSGPSSMSYSQVQVGGPSSRRGSRSGNSGASRGSGAGSSPASALGMLPGEEAMDIEIRAQGYQFVAVRAVFPIREQIQKYAQATNRPFAVAARDFGIMDFAMERQTAVPGQDQWSGPWQTVNIQDAIDVLDNSYDFDAEVVNSMITDNVITMQLPMRLTGEWNTLARHPLIEQFKLSPEEIELESRLQHQILSEARDQQKQISAFSQSRGGFARQSLDTRGLMADTFGSGAMYGGDFGGLGSSGSGPGMMSPGGAGGRGAGMSMPGGPRGSSMMGMPSTGGGRSGRGNAVAADPVQKLIQDMVKDKTANKEEEIQRIQSWIQKRASAEGELLLFRYFDFNVEPGKTYRYRVKLILRNPNYGKPPAMAGGMVHITEGETRDTPWSQITEPVTVQDDVRYFATDVRDEINRALPIARYDVFEWSSAIGTYVNSLLNVRLGQVISDEVDTTVIDPAKELIESRKFQFNSKDYLVDMVSEIRLDSSLHERATDGTTVKLPVGSAGKVPLPPVTLVAKSDDRLQYVNPVTLRTVHASFKRNMENQSKQFEYLKNPPESAGLAGMSGGEEGMLMGGARSNRSRNVLRLNSTPTGPRSGSSPGATSGGRR